MIRKNDIISAIKNTGLNGSCVCIHASMKSFGCEVKGGAETIIDAFLDSGCTLLVPTFTRCEVKPPGEKWPVQNGMDESTLRIFSNDDRIFSADSDYTEIKEMGILADAVLGYEERARGNHPLCSFTALGPYAKELVREQAPMDVFAPLRELALFNGFILLMGTGLNRMTALHLAEQMAGRNMFIRWTKGPDGAVIEAEAGGCSEGFINFEPYMSGIDRQVKAGESVWRAFPAGKILKKAARIIQVSPEITRCGSEGCLMCEHAVAGGPVL